MIEEYYTNTITSKRLTVTLNTIKETWVDKLTGTACRIEVLNVNDAKMWIGAIDILEEDRIVDGVSGNIYVVTQVVPMYKRKGDLTPHHNECVLELFQEP
jgi:hypothetical protein